MGQCFECGHQTKPTTNICEPCLDKRRSLSYRHPEESSLRAWKRIEQVQKQAPGMPIARTGWRTL